jgi:hypothetical protein
MGHLATTTREVQSERSRHVITIKRAAILEPPAWRIRRCRCEGEKASPFVSIVVLPNATVIIEGNNFETVLMPNAATGEMARSKNRLRHQW